MQTVRKKGRLIANRPLFLQGMISCLLMFRIRFAWLFLPPCVGESRTNQCVGLCVLDPFCPLRTAVPLGGVGNPFSSPSRCRCHLSREEDLRAPLLPLPKKNRSPIRKSSTLLYTAQLVAAGAKRSKSYDRGHVIMGIRVEKVVPFSSSQRAL